MRNHFFITGTDAGVGKTTLAALLCAALDAVYWKPIQTGTLEGSDRVSVMRLAGIGTDRTIDEVYKFVPPVSPDLAARWAGTEIDLARIVAQVRHRALLVANDRNRLHLHHHAWLGQAADGDGVGGGDKRAETHGDEQEQNTGAGPAGCAPARPE